MNFLELLFPKKREPRAFDSLKLINGYTPVYRSWGGKLYESQYVRTAIDARARHISKLAVTITGGTQSELLTRIKKKPNQYSTWSQFLYRVSTILDLKSNAFILPTRDKYGQKTGVFPIYPSAWELVTDEKNNIWVRFEFEGKKATAELLSDIGILTRYQCESDFFGDDNVVPLTDTMQLIKIQKQGIEEYTKNASSYRFMAQLTNFSTAEDLTKERQRFDSENFQSEGGGMLLFPNTYKDIKQITPHNYTVDSAQLELIQENVYDYFGVSKDVIQNKSYGDAFSAFYEGAIEPVAVQLSEVLTGMLFTEREIAFGSAIFFTANRIQYMTNSDKLNVSKDLVDRGVLSINEARDVWQLAPIDGGDIHILRGEYYNSTTGEKVEQIGAEDEK